MADFSGLPLAILRSVSRLSGEDYAAVDQPELCEELARRGFEPSQRALHETVRALERDGYLQVLHWMPAGGGPEAMRLDTLGRRMVEGWPASPGSISTAEVEGLVAELDRRSKDETLTPDERSKARAAAQALGSLGLSVAGGVIVSWLKSIGV